MNTSTRLRLVAVLPTVTLAAAGCGSHRIETTRQAANVVATETPTSVATAAVPPRPTPTKRRVHVVLGACDANIEVKAATTSCAFAQNVFYAYWHAEQAGHASSVEAYSPVTRRTYALECVERAFIS